MMTHHVGARPVSLAFTLAPFVVPTDLIASAGDCTTSSRANHWPGLEIAVPGALDSKMSRLRDFRSVSADGSGRFGDRRKTSLRDSLGTRRRGASTLP